MELNGWIAALIAILIIGFIGLSIGIWALYQKKVGQEKY
jgi:hypothetical protein